MVVNSHDQHRAGAEIPAGPTTSGIAWDGATASRSRCRSRRAGWRNATWAGHGRFLSGRGLPPGERGALTVMAKASNRAGATQTFELIANPAGYHHNVVQRIALAIG